MPSRVSVISRCRTAFKRSEQGSALIELALVAPVLLLFVVGVADFGRVFFTAIALANAAEAGAQYGAQSTAYSGDTAAINAMTRSDAADAGTIIATSRQYCRCPDGSASACTATCPDLSVPQVFVEATATDSVDLILRYPPLSSKILVSRTATFRAQ